MFLTDDPTFAATIRDGDMGARSIVGSNDELVASLGEYVELGFDEFIVPDFTLGNTPEERADRYRMLQADVIPQLA